jgi:hypothetical protein
MTIACHPAAFDRAARQPALRAAPRQTSLADGLHADYAALYEREVRPGRGMRRGLARAVWLGLFLVRPRLALEIWRERAAA